MIVYDIRDLVKVYPGQTTLANQNITLQIHQGEIFGLLGDNGAGKSTLVKQMVNLVRSTSGSITLFGQPIQRDPLYVPMNVGYMPQDSLALNNLTVDEALFFTAHLRGLSRADANWERDVLLDLLQMRELRSKIVPKLSGGEKRLLQIAIALAGNPPVLILDEPTNNLDPQRRKLIWETLRRLNRENGTTVIFITHDAIEAEKVIQRVGILREGELVALGKPSELKALVDRKLRLELFFSPESPPRLPPTLPCRKLDAGRWLVLLEWEEMMPVLNLLDLSQLDDFRLYTATLEDLYLHYAKQSA
jgi:ABC-2 type transport system ATP-binding protein